MKKALATLCLAVIAALSFPVKAQNLTLADVAKMLNQEMASDSTISQVKAEGNTLVMVVNSASFGKEFNDLIKLIDYSNEAEFIKMTKPIILESLGGSGKDLANVLDMFGANFQIRIPAGNKNLNLPFTAGELRNH